MSNNYLKPDQRFDEHGNIISVAEAVKRWGKTAAYNSETAKCLPLLMPYLKGNIVEAASGGWPVLPHVIQIELPESEFAEYTGGRQEDFPIQWRGSAWDLPFKDNTVDVFISSHYLEDNEFEKWPQLLGEWKRVLKPGGKMLILTPDKERWQHYLDLGNIPNCSHRHEPVFGEVSSMGKSIGLKLVEERFCWPFPEHSVLTVFEK